jgi:hypothetical protein
MPLVVLPRTVLPGYIHGPSVMQERQVGLGVRVYPVFWAGFFGFFIFRPSNIYTRTLTRNFGYP